MSKYCSLVSSTKFHAVLHYKYHFVKNTNGKLTSNEQYFCLWLNNRVLSKYEKHDEPKCIPMIGLLVFLFVNQ